MQSNFSELVMSGSTKVAATPADNIAPAFNMGLCGLSVEEKIEVVNFYILSMYFGKVKQELTF